MKLTMSLKELLSTSKTKKDLTCLFAQALLQRFSQKPSFKLVVIYETKIKGQNFEEEHSHKEADTLIPQQVLASLRDEPLCGHPTLMSSSFCCISPPQDVSTVKLV